MFDFTKIFRMLLPKGSAWNINLSVQFKDVISAFMNIATEIKNLSQQTKNDVFPDTTTQIPLWEQQFNLPIADGLTEQQRRDRIATQWRTQGGQSVSYMNSVIASLGIDAVIYENFQFYNFTFGDGSTFGDGQTFQGGTSIDPSSFFTTSYPCTFGDGGTFGDGTTFCAGLLNETLLVNGYIPNKAYNISQDSEYWIFYWILASPLGVDIPAQIPIELKNTLFTELLKIKPVHTRGIINANFF
jgi:hypothetical protein